MKIKPFIRWAGGKQKQLSQIQPYFPAPSLVKTYYEPFLGGGTLFLNNDFDKSYISDVNKHLINAFQKIKINPVKVSDTLNSIGGRISPKRYYLLRDEFNMNKYSYTYKQAANFIILNKASYNGVFRVNKKGEYNVPFGKEYPSLPTLEELELISQKLKSAEIHSHKFGNILDHITKDDFIYLDPPYPPISETAFFQHYTKRRFDLNDQERVFIFFQELSDNNIKVLLSYPDLPIVRQTYKDFNIITLPTYRSIKSKGKVLRINELLISNY